MSVLDLCCVNDLWFAIVSKCAAVIAMAVPVDGIA
jgi:hypothetical protein